MSKVMTYLFLMSCVFGVADTACKTSRVSAVVLLSSDLMCCTSGMPPPYQVWSSRCVLMELCQ